MALILRDDEFSDALEEGFVLDEERKALARREEEAFFDGAFIPDAEEVDEARPRPLSMPAALPDTLFVLLRRTGVASSTDKFCELLPADTDRAPSFVRGLVPPCWDVLLGNAATLAVADEGKDGMLGLVPLSEALRLRNCSMLCRAQFDGFLIALADRRFSVEGRVADIPIPES